MRRIFASLCFALCFVVAAPATATAPMGDLIRLSQILGEAHALRVACKGRSDQEWRDFMREVLVLETDGDFTKRDRLVDAFNTGFRTAGASGGFCPEDAEEQEAALAERGRALAEQLAGRYLD